MNKGDIEKIIAIAEEGSMAKAAQKLYISQPALSKCLTKIEHELAEVLFIRRPNGLTATYAGKCFIQKAYQIMRLYDELEFEFCELNQMRKGTLKIGATERMSALVLPDVLQKFHSLYPNIHVDLIEKNSYELEEQILLGALDMAIILLPTKNEYLNYKVFYQDPYLVAIPKDHPLNAKGYRKSGENLPFIDLNDLKGASLILTTRKRKTRIITNRILSHLANDYKITLETNNIETVIRMVATGIGISIVPSVFAKAYNEEDRIRYYRMEEDVEVYHEWAVIYSDSLENLTRPSKELYRILCEENCIFPDFIG